MTLNKRLLTLLSLLVISFVLLPHSQAKAGRFLTKICKKTTIRASGRLRLDRYLGKVSARVFWRGKVKRRFGWKYAAWSLARRKSVKCRLRRRGMYFRCVVRAQPCTLVRKRYRRRRYR